MIIHPQHRGRDEIHQSVPILSILGSFDYISRSRPTSNWVPSHTHGQIYRGSDVLLSCAALDVIEILKGGGARGHTAVGVRDDYGVMLLTVQDWEKHTHANVFSVVFGGDGCLGLHGWE